MVMRRRSAEFKVAGSLGTAWAEEHAGPIQSWEDLEKYPWPDPDAVDYGQLEYYERHLPEDMGVFHVVKVGEVVRELFGFESFCWKMHEEPKLVDEGQAARLVQQEPRLDSDPRARGAVFGETFRTEVVSLR